MNWTDLWESDLSGFLAWAASQPWCKAMAECQQDARWHAEGDVWTHTQMVCQQLTKLEQWPELSKRDQVILICTALFHDSAKPLTTQIDPVSGQIRSPNHAVKGEHLARGVLRELGCDLKTREQITGLVRYHGRPAFLLEKERPAHEVVRLSWLVSNRLLYLFALADTRGRNTDSMSRPEENLHFWKLQAEELDCFDRPYDFPSDHARYTFFHQRDPNLHYQPHEAFSCEVTMLSGLPGSGKDTWLRRNRELPVVSLDEIRRELKVDPTDNQGVVVQEATERCREYLRLKKPFAFNATNLLRQTRSRWLGLMADYKAKLELVYVEPPLDRILDQNGRRANPVPEHVIRKLAAKVEPPTWLEPHSLIVTDGESDFSAT